MSVIDLIANIFRQYANETGTDAIHLQKKLWSAFKARIVRGINSAPTMVELKESRLRGAPTAVSAFEGMNFLAGGAGW